MAAATSHTLVAVRCLEETLLCYLHRRPASEARSAPRQACLASQVSLRSKTIHVKFTDVGMVTS